MWSHHFLNVDFTLLLKYSEDLASLSLHSLMATMKKRRCPLEMGMFPPIHHSPHRSLLYATQPSSLMTLFVTSKGVQVCDDGPFFI